MGKGRFFLLASIAWAILSSAGCKSLYKDYGTIVPNKEVTQAFEIYQIDPDLNYYISGPDMFPNAIMGLNKAYTLDNDLWKKIEMTPEVFRNLVGNMQTRASELSRFQHGFAILDDKGRQIGIWYSPLDAGAVIKIQDERTVIIHTPPLDLYERQNKEDIYIHIPRP